MRGAVDERIEQAASQRGDLRWAPGAAGVEASGST